MSDDIPLTPTPTSRPDDGNGEEPPAESLVTVTDLGPAYIAGYQHGYRRGYGKGKTEGFAEGNKKGYEAARRDFGKKNAPAAGGAAPAGAAGGAAPGTNVG
jgi:hypothetical protein